MKNIEKIQHLLPLGYIFLVILGIIKESVAFYQIGINILKYSSIMDILISPLATLTLHPLILIVIVLLFVLAFYLPTILLKYGHKRWVQKAFGLEETQNKISDETIKNDYVNISIRFLAMMLASFFLGFGIEKGRGTAQNIKNNTLVYKHKLYYHTGQSEDIHLIELNSLYYFYVSKTDKFIKIAPINSIRSIELIKNKILE